MYLGLGSKADASSGSCAVLAGMTSLRQVAITLDIYIHVNSIYSFRYNPDGISGQRHAWNRLLECLHNLPTQPRLLRLSTADKVEPKLEPYRMRPLKAVIPVAWLEDAVKTMCVKLPFSSGFTLDIVIDSLAAAQSMAQPLSTKCTKFSITYIASSNSPIHATCLPEIQLPFVRTEIKSACSDGEAGLARASTTSTSISMACHRSTHCQSPRTGK